MSTHYKVDVTQSAHRLPLRASSTKSSTYFAATPLSRSTQYPPWERIIRHNVRAHREATWSHCILLDSAYPTGPDLTFSGSIQSSLLYVCVSAEALLLHQLTNNLTLWYQACLIYRTSQQQMLSTNKHTSEPNKSSPRNRRENGRAIFGTLLIRVQRSGSSYLR